MRRFLGAIILLVITTSALRAGEKHVALSSTIQSQRDSDGAEEIINEIIRVLGLKANFEVRAANIPNAAAVNYHGTRFILYNPAFFNELNEAAGNNWASVSVLAHEIGHHLN